MFKRRLKKTDKAILLLVSVLVGAFVFSFKVLPVLFSDHYQFQAPANSESAVLEAAQEPKVAHLKTPEIVKGIYMTSCVAGSHNLRDQLVALADTTEINTIVIDIKDYSGTLSFIPTDLDLQKSISTRCMATDMPEFVKLLHDKNIYVIGRVTVFQDPFYAVRHPDLAVKRASDGGIWKDKKGISYLDPGSPEVWDYIVSISKEAYDIGFDEINYDYIRFPSDGNMRDIAFPFSANQSKPEVLEEFFSYLDQRLKTYQIPHSADLFGMTTTNYDDLNIGQVLERALPYFDYVDPMVYPSHYPPTFNGWKNPNNHPYELIYYVMKEGVRRTIATSSPIDTLESQPIASSTLFTKTSWDKNKMRPWLQDFDYGGDYGPDEVKAQIQATYDAGLTSWLLWSPSNRYTREALVQE